MRARLLFARKVLWTWISGKGEIEELERFWGRTEQQDELEERKKGGDSNVQLSSSIDDPLSNPVVHIHARHGPTHSGLSPTRKRARRPIDNPTH